MTETSSYVYGAWGVVYASIDRGLDQTRYFLDFEILGSLMPHYCVVVKVSNAHMSCGPTRIDDQSIFDNLVKYVNLRVKEYLDIYIDNSFTEPTEKRVVHQSAVDGRYVSAEDAKESPDD